METHQIDRVKARGDLIKDRDNLRKALQADKVNEQGVRKAYKKLVFGTRGHADLADKK